MNDTLRDTTSWSVIVGLVMPWLVAVVNRPNWARWLRTTVAVVCSAVGGVLTTLATGAFHEGALTVFGACATVLAASQAVYGKLYARSQKTLESATSGRHARQHHTDGEQRHAAR